MLRLPEPMLARAGEVPRGTGWIHEPKMDGFRALICTHGGLRVRSRRGWNMTRFLPELRALPDDVQLDGELVALDDNGLPDFHRLSSRLLHGRDGISVMYFAFDVLAVEGLATTMLPYAKRRALLEELDVEGPYVQPVATFEDGEALFYAVRAHGLEGIVSERLNEAYKSGERGWIKCKNRATARFAEERARALSAGRGRR